MSYSWNRKVHSFIRGAYFTQLLLQYLNTQFLKSYLNQALSLYFIPSLKWVYFSFHGSLNYQITLIFLSLLTPCFTPFSPKIFLFCFACRSTYTFILAKTVSLYIKCIIWVQGCVHLYNWTLDEWVKFIVSDHYTSLDCIVKKKKKKKLLYQKNHSLGYIPFHDRTQRLTES